MSSKWYSIFRYQDRDGMILLWLNVNIMRQKYSGNTKRMLSWNSWRFWDTIWLIISWFITESNTFLRIYKSQANPRWNDYAHYKFFTSCHPYHRYRQLGTSHRSMGPWTLLQKVIHETIILLQSLVGSLFAESVHNVLSDLLISLSVGMTR